MKNPLTEEELIAAIQESVDIFAAREHVSTELPSAETTRKFEIGQILAISILADLSGQWIVSCAFGAVEFFVERTPEGEVHVAYEDIAIGLLPLFLVGIRDVAEGTCILGVARPCTVDSILSQTAIVLATVGPRIDQIRNTPATHALAVAYETLQDGIVALLDLTLHAMQGPWNPKNHSLHADIVRETLTLAANMDALIAGAQ